MEDRPQVTTCCRAREVSLRLNSRQIDWNTTAGKPNHDIDFVALATIARIRVA
jgi:hypothetical protein